MSRSDSRQVSWANAMTRKTSAQPKVRTPASPWCRSMMRPKVFHGTNSMTCANSVLPTCMRHSGRSTARSIVIWHGTIQIVDTLEIAELAITIDFTTAPSQLNRTLLATADGRDLSGSASGRRSIGGGAGGYVAGGVQMGGTVATPPALRPGC